MEYHVGGMRLRLPEGYSAPAMQEQEPAETLTLMKETVEMSAVVTVRTAGPDEVLPEGEWTLIDRLHEGLGDRQGIIEVRSGSTAQGRRYIYSLVKNGKDPEGVWYELNGDFCFEGGVLRVSGRFDEEAAGVERENIVFNLSARMNEIDIMTYSWYQDPYEEGLVKGLRMNMSEEEQFDEYFPAHPLSQARALMRDIIELN